MNKINSVFRKFPQTFWIANTMELFERWAWYGMFMLLALYLTGSTDEGALGFSHSQKGLMMGVVTAMLYILPIITGALADKFGYRKVLMISFATLSCGYFMMGSFDSYTAVFMAFIFLGIGAGLFKPVIQATVAKTTNSETSSIGFGLFYMMVNIGAFIGPVVASKLRIMDWQYVFYMSSGIILINFILVIFFYKEPERNVVDESIGQSLKTIAVNIKTVLTDIKFVIFLLIIIGFWTMYNQLFYTLPNFIDQWIDTRPLYDALASISPSFAATVGTPAKTIAAEMITNMDAMYIILFQVLVSAIVMRLKPLTSMFSGILVSTIGLSLTFLAGNSIFIIFTLLIFALGEMAGSPKISEYVGRIAPADKTGLYMGMSFIPLAGGNLFAGIISGNLYQNMSDKITLLQTEVTARGLKIEAISEKFTQNDFIREACRQMQMTPEQLTQYLWKTYQPQKIWIVMFAIGFLTVVALFLYDKIVNSKTKKHKQ